MANYVKNNQSEAELIDEIKEQYKLSKLYLDPIHEKMNQQEELYRSFLDKNNYPHNAMVFDPRTFRVIETITPRMVANEPTGSFYPQEAGDSATTHILNSLFKYDWRRAEMFPKLVMSAKSMLIFGTFFGRNFWDYRTTWKERMIPKKVNGRMIWTPKNKEKIEVTEFDGPNYELFNLYDCFPDPNATSLHNLRWFVYRRFVTIDELEATNDARGAEYYKNLDKLKEAIHYKKAKKAEGALPEDINWRQHRRTMLSTQEFIGKDDSNPDIVILHRLTKDGWCEVASEYDIVIREVQNPYFHGDLPIVYGVDYPYPGELYGMGEIEPIDRIQRAINAVLNQRLDNVQLTLRPMWKVKKQSGVDMHTLYSAPGNIVTTGDMTAVDMFTIPDVTGPTFVQTMNYLTSSLQNGSGITDYTIGVGNDSNVANKTATGTRLIQQEANAQFKLKIQLFNHMVIQRIANQWKDLRIQYTTDKQMLRILGEDGIRYLRDNTNLSKVDLDGNPIVPGDLETPAKLQIGKDESFAFLTLFPEDIQPSIVGDYDYISAVSSDQLNDPIALQENFFTAIERTSQPQWQQGLQAQGKMLDYVSLTQQIFEKLNLGLETKKVIVDIPQMNQQPTNNQELTDQQLNEMIGAPMEDPLALPGEEMYGQTA